MIVWTPAVLSVLYAYDLYFCICTCSGQMNMFHMERRPRSTLIYYDNENDDDDDDDDNNYYYY